MGACKDSVFGKEWTLCVFDEAHALRTEGNLTLAAHGMRIKSSMMILASATPLYNSETVSAVCVVTYVVRDFYFTVQDLVYLGCAMGVRKYVELYKTAKELKKDIAKLRKKKEDREMEKIGMKSDAKALTAGENIGKSGFEYLTDRRVDVVKQMRALFENAIIRRTRSSYDFDRKPISGLIPRVLIDFNLQMTPEEIEKFKRIKIRTAERM